MRWKIPAIILACCAAALALWGVRPLYSAYQERRALADARTFLEQEDYSKAALLARRALQYKPASIEASRLMAQLAERAGSPESLVWWRRVVELDEAPANRFSLAAAALIFEPPPYVTAQEMLDSFAPSEKKSAGYHRLAATLALRMQRLGEAEEHFAEALKLDPGRKNDQLNLAMLRLNSREDGIVNTARRTLEGFFSDDSFAPMALRALITHHLQRNEATAAAAYSRQLLAHLSAAFEDQVQHLDILLATGDEDYTRYLIFLKSEAGASAVDCARIAAHLMSSGNPRRVLEWFASLPAPVQQQQPIPRLAAECHMLLKDWRGLETFLREKRWKEDEPLRLALLARALREQQDGEFARVNWQRAVKLALQRLETAQALLALSQQWGWEQETEKLIWDISERFPRDPGAAQEIERFYHSRGDTWGLYRFYSERIKLDADNPAVKNNLALVLLLLKLSLEEAHGLAREAFEQRPDHPDFAATFAFSLHLQGKTAAGLEVFSRLSPSQLQRPGVAAYHAILLSAMGEKIETGRSLALARLGPLLPEEQLLLADVDQRIGSK
jgi:hypothetical protein